MPNNSLSCITLFVYYSFSVLAKKLPVAVLDPSKHSVKNEESIKCLWNAFNTKTGNDFNACENAQQWLT